MPPYDELVMWVFPLLLWVKKLGLRENKFRISSGSQSQSVVRLGFVPKLCLQTIFPLRSCSCRTFSSPCLCFAADPCSMDPMAGECQDYTLKWYYDKEKQSCQQFWYGSCGGNANRFETQRDCEARCVPTLP